MTFLNPAILFGLLAASIPIVLHFLNLRKLKKIEFSTLSFLKELQKTKIRRIKLKQWLLLLLRIIIIIVLVMAFARPTVKTFSIGNSSAAKTTAVIIVDNTFSMSVVSENGSYLNRSKSIAKTLLANFQDGDEISLIAAGDLSDEISKPTTNFKQLIRSIDEVQTSYVSRTLNEAMIQAARVIYQSKNFNKEIYFLTDFQKSRIYNSQKELADLSGMLGENTRIYLVDAGGKETANLGIEELIPNNQIFEKGKSVGFTARVKNYSDRPEANSVVSLFVNGKRSAQQSVNLAGGEARDVSFETTLADTGLVEISAELEDDEILQDNKRFFSVSVPDKISLLLLTDQSADAKFIRLALDGPQSKIIIAQNSTSQIPSLNLNNYDAVFLIGSEKNSDWKNLAGYVERGGKVTIMPGSQSTLAGYQKLCASLNISPPAGETGKINSTEFPLQFDKVDLQNPFFADLFESRIKPQIESPGIYYYFKINPGGTGKSMITMFDNSSFLSEYKRGTGKIFLFNSAPLLNWSDFPLKGFFPPLINKLILYSASKTKEQNNYLPGQEVIADISNHTVQQIVIRKPDELREFVNADSLSNKNYLSYSRTDETGTYKFYSANKLLDYIFVNHDPRESDLQRSSDTELENYLKEIGFGGKLIFLSPEEDFSKVIYQSRFGTELWKYLLMAVLLLAIAESIVARSSKKDLAEVSS